MIIILLTTQSFIKKELEKSKYNEKLLIIENINDIYDLNLEDKKFILIQHLDINENNLYPFLNKNFLNYYLVALRNNTNNIEACNLLKKGYKAYAHSLSSHEVFNDIIESIKLGNTWVYPELMNFIISSIPVENNEKETIINKITIKELEVLKLLAEGLNNITIADTLKIAEVTVKKHVSSLLKKLELKDRLSLALFYRNNSEV